MFNLGKESYICCLLGPLWSVYNKGFFKIPLFSSSSVVLRVLNPPSGVENSNVKYPPCHTSKVESWYVHWRYELCLSPSFSLWLKVSKTIRKTGMEENNGILKNPLCTLQKGPKCHVESHAKMTWSTSTTQSIAADRLID